MATIKEVSRLAGVSIATVSNVINGSAPVADKTKKRVLNAVEKLNYEPNAFARGLITKRSGGIGVTVNDLTSPFFGALLKGIESVVEAAGMHLMVSSGHAGSETEKRSVDFLRQRRADALIVYLEGVSDDDLLTWMKTGPPLIIVGRRHIPELEKVSVWLNNERGGYLATEHLINNGHTRIAHLAGKMTHQDGRDRLRGYRAALDAAGLPFDPELVIESDFTEIGGQHAAEQLLKRDLSMTALFAANDQTAAGALNALRGANVRVPEDLSVVGYDDILLASFLYAPLTTVRQPMLEMGQSAARLALAALDTPAQGEVKRQFEPELIQRASVKRL